jgi:hypothetical protein
MHVHPIIHPSKAALQIHFRNDDFFLQLLPYLLQLGTRKRAPTSTLLLDPQSSTHAANNSFFEIFNENA